MTLLLAFVIGLCSLLIGIFIGGYVALRGVDKVLEEIMKDLPL